MPDEIQTQVGGAAVTINPAPTPSETLVAAAANKVIVTDALGRSITLQKPKPLQNLDFAKAAGAGGLNQLYLVEVAHLKYVAAIDGEPVFTPASDGELRALYARLGDEGNEAAQLAVFENFMKPSEDGDAALKNF